MSTETLPEVLPDIEHENEDVERTSKTYLPLYKVIMWDDDMTTMEFVIRILTNLFRKDYTTAEKLMYEIHFKGAAHVETLPLEQAEFKVEQVHSAAAMEQFPFRCTIEPV
ncbi:MAG: ATP-dependent Clp protease adaptor ClpS [Nitrospinaceae bacterium]|jgi:ATP-dependent Clp protease adaptor protein ClpS|nr:ATP-dependent Clp protease adaptor ClpS [Nitrospinaceae bacterium]MDP6657084.1 ATP-dependent Clp protease adaptor ClpS [Nitrospinaceae bacterium]MDP6711410.1 ATP-dependent Clp protease adaptor ClpS [Nitrospinaceae bacterium]MDP7057932.1 ATP-dependent Clp protease adaptor ClpS [Nitrospinaceae bacterium]HAK38048.1 Clp protease ClpS [Nitrospina sp.]|tara:strand:- start:1516 stop:1845 length:330 start_codon:yes stop_codon:yes gene_type:complete